MRGNISPSNMHTRTAKKTTIFISKMYVSLPPWNKTKFRLSFPIGQEGLRGLLEDIIVLVKKH